MTRINPFVKILSGHGSGIPYLNGQSWITLSREERLFCSYLYHDLLSQKFRDNFFDVFNNVTCPVAEYRNPEILTNANMHWEVGYEVCFYRDLIYEYDSKGIRSFQKKHGIKLPEKRTFDLCLFSENELWIIEAKAQQGLDGIQCEEFAKDKERVETLLKILSPKEKKPKVGLIVLAASEYFTSKSFSMKAGIGNCLIRKCSGNMPLGFISWKELSRINCEGTDYSSVYELADKLFG